jgi:hypothetical protein
MSTTRLASAVAVVVAAIAAVSGLTISNADSAPSSCPTGWTCGDIGDPTPAGSQSLTGSSTWQVQGGGANIWGQSDSFHFVWQSLPGDGTAGTQVVAQTDTDQNAKAGVMMRSSTDSDSAYYGVFLTPAHGLVVQFRSGPGQFAANAGGKALTAPSFVEVVRSGSTFTAMTSNDGQTWTKVSGSTKTVPSLSGNLLAGLAVTSHNPNETSDVTFGAQSGTGVSGSGTTGSDPDGGSTGSTTSTTSGPPPSTTTSSTTSPPSTTTTTTATVGSGGVSVCGTALCVDGSPWSMYGSTIYNPGLQPIQSGIKDPTGTVALVEQAHLNTIRITDFLNVKGSPTVAPYDPTQWGHVDAMIAAAQNAGLHVDLELSDYRALLWNNCINPYTSGDWPGFISFVTNRVNTVSHLVYKNDPTIAMVSIAGEPLPTGAKTFTAKVGGQPCSLFYSTADLTNFYDRTLSAWENQGGTVMVNTGGLGYLNGTTSAGQPLGYGGIDWKSIFSLPSDPFCDIKTYGGMQAYAPTVASFCHSIGKPILDEEFGWTQGMGDATRAQEYATMFSQLKALGFAGEEFWNLGYQVGSTSYEVNPSTPLTFSEIAQNAP